MFFRLFKEMFQVWSKKEPENGGYNREWTRQMINPNIKSQLYEEDRDEKDYYEEVPEEKEEDILNFDFTKLSTDKRKKDDTDEE
ncbi:MAG TPA: hypothetical protein DCP90_01465 [Clostridiales bacterium]|nr:MAG: hypothetical protein A2Y22_05395 [Clostridiales bacterium GWD2_32_59]HAN09264.1 hypothetical protein [Clostridiales bacterium]